MITMIQPLPVGNALRLFLTPPAGAVRWKILRNGCGVFAGITDPNSILAYEGRDITVVDAEFLQNSIMAYYQPYYTTDGHTWTAGGVSSGTPAATYQDASTDVLGLLRARLESMFHVEVQRGTISAPGLGYVQVYTAPPSMEHELRFPLITLHQNSEDPEERSIGEMMEPDALDVTSGLWVEDEGWMARVQIEVVAWSLNPDERIQLRKSLRTAVVANLPVFDAAGMLEINFSMQDVDAVSGEYSSPMYQVSCSFSCLAPVIVRSADGITVDSVTLAVTSNPAVFSSTAQII